jgi:glycosyltransferase involved in cell wall biosynthesis
MRIVAIMYCYNEQDVIAQTVDHLLDSGLELVVVDNGSDDGTYELLAERRGRGVVHLERMPTETFDLYRLLARLSEVLPRHAPDWVLRVDADEFPEGPSPGARLADSIAAEDAAGHNIVQFNMFEFWPTDADDAGEADVRRRLRHYSWISDWQFCAWKHHAGTDIVASGGHLPVFPRPVPPRVSPVKYVKRHYPIRSEAQGMKRIFRDRVPRLPPAVPHAGQRYYERFAPERATFVLDPARLTRYEEDGRWCLERKFAGWRDPGLITSSCVAFHEFYLHRELVARQAAEAGDDGHRRRAPSLGAVWRRLTGGARRRRA